MSGYRGKERIVYSNDGLIYYTKDHVDMSRQKGCGIHAENPDRRFETSLAKGV